MAEENILETHFIKNEAFRTIYGSGIFGGITPRGLIDMNFYTERVPIPTKISYVRGQPVEGGTRMEEIGREGREGAIREVQFGVILDLNTAKGIARWLEEQIQLYEQLEKK